MAKLNDADRIDWSRAAIDSSHVRAFGGRQDRPEPGRPLPDDSARGRDPTGAWTARTAASPTERLFGDRAYHSREGRSALRRRRQARIAWPSHGSGLGKQRWVVERTIGWLHQYRRLRVRYERRDDIHEAFLAIGCSLICLKPLQAQESSAG